MRTFKNINNDFVPSVDLNVLGKTFDTLEQGHKEAVKAASDLEIALANYDLNEAEDEWKQQKINEIRQTIADNTLYGNSYSALDDITAKLGDLYANSGLLGRINAQKEYKEFTNRIKNDNSLPQNYKEYYLENNPYYYKDKIDKKGNVIGGTRWSPIKSPTQVIDGSRLLTQAISIAAKQHGGGNVTRWLDENGKVTNDPSKAFDGQVFSTTSQQWETLSKDKIWQALDSVIENTPGAKESLQQDYDVALWEHDKLVKANNGKPVVSSVTDNQGVVLSDPVKYLRKRFSSGVNAASYYNVVSNTSYGSGLASYNAARNAERNTTNINNMVNDLITSTPGTPVEIEQNPAASFISIKNTAKRYMQDMYKSITGRNLYIPDNATFSNINKLLDKYNVPAQYKTQFKSYVNAYKEANDNLKAYTNNMSNKDKKNFEFASRMKSGGEIINSKNGGSKNDDKIINTFNKIYRPGVESIAINLSDKTAQNVKDILDGNEYNGAKKLGVYFNGNKLIIPKAAKEVLPMIASITKKAEARSNKGILPTIYGIIADRYNIELLDNNGNIINKAISNIGSASWRGNENATIKNNFVKLASIYDNSVNQYDSIIKKYNAAPSKATMSSLNLDGKTFTDAFLLDKLNKGFIDNATYEKNKKYLEESFGQQLLGTNFSQKEMYYSEGGGVRKKVTDSAKRYELGAELIQAYKDGRVSISPTIVAGSVDPITGAPIAGYNFTILPKTDNKGNYLNPDYQAGKDENKIKSFYMPGFYNEKASELIMQSSKVQAFNAVQTIGSSKSFRNLTDENVNPVLGRTFIQGLGNNNFNIAFSGIKRTVDDSDAQSFVLAINDYKEAKNVFLSSGNNKIGGPIASTIANSAKTIGKVFNINPESVLDYLLLDINK